MRRLCTAAASLLSILVCASPAHAQLPMGIPDLCLGSPDNIAPGQTATWSGTVTKGTVCVYGRLIISPGTHASVINLWPMVGGEIVADTRESIALPVTVSYLDAPLDLSRDPEQFGNGTIVFGTLALRGKVKTPTVGLAATVAPNSVTLILAQSPDGWSRGDRLVLPGTRQIERNWGNPTRPIDESEVVTVDEVNGTVVTLQTPTLFAHGPAREEDGTVVAWPHVGNLTRSIILRSENPAGVRGHVLATMRADVNIQHVAFVGLGRTTNDPLDCTLRTVGAVQGPGPNPGATHSCEPGTGPVTYLGRNHIGRYALHMHHLFGPASPQANGRQFTLVGNAIEDPSKWGVTIHNSHYGLIADNVIYDPLGAGVMTEDGSETGNIIEGNFIVRVWGTGGRQGGGREGVGLYLRGPFNRVRDNVVANVYSDGPDAAYCAKYFFTYLGTVRQPTRQGETTTVLVDAHAQPITEDARTTCYASEAGLTYWWVGSFGDELRTIDRSVFNGFLGWHLTNKGVFNYPSSRVTLKDFRLHMDPAFQAANGTGIEGGDYLAHDWEIVNPRISYFAQGITTSAMHGGAPQLIQGGVLRNTQNIAVRNLLTSSYRADQIPGRFVSIVSTRFATPASSNPVWLQGIRGWLVYDYRTNGVRNFIQRDEVTVTDFNGVAGDTFRWFYPQQAPSFIVPATVSNSDGTPAQLGSPTPNLTNAQAFAQHGLAIAGSVAPCATTRPNVTGFACASDAPLPPPPPPVEVCGDGVDNDGDGQIDEGCAPPPPPPVDVCVSDPLRVTKIAWPAQPTGRRSLTFDVGSKTWVSFSFLWPGTLTVTDARGCTVTVIK